MEKTDERKGEKRRERCKNFTEKEKELAIGIIDRYRHIIENKRSDGVCLKEKKQAWENVAEEFNAMAVSAPRGPQQLKILWSNLRRSAKKTVAEENKRKYLDQEDYELHIKVADLKKKKNIDKKNMSQTGGVQCSGQLSEVDARVLALVEEQLRPLANFYDDDNTYHGDIALSSGPNASPSLTPEPTAGPSHPIIIEVLEIPEPEVPEGPTKEFIPPKRKQTKKNANQERY